jgi:nucleoid DNA-binding protein
MTKKDTNSTATAANKPLAKNALVAALVDYEGNNRSKADATRLLTALSGLVAAELKRVGTVVIPGIVLLTVVTKPATPERTGVSPFTKEMTTFKARPASARIKARASRPLKDAVTKT